MEMKALKATKYGTSKKCVGSLAKNPNRDFPRRSCSCESSKIEIGIWSSSKTMNQRGLSSLSLQLIEKIITWNLEHSPTKDARVERLASSVEFPIR